MLITSQLVACQSVNKKHHHTVSIELGDKGQQAFKYLKVGDIEWVTIGDLLPTQMNIGQKQNAYKLARWQKEPQKKFEALCESFGMRAKVKHFDPLSANVHDPNSFKCAEPRKNKEGPLKKDKNGQWRATELMTKVYVAPNGELYLIDGHHANSRFHDMSGGGPDVPVLVNVVGNLSELQSMNQFWLQMVEQGNAYLFNNGRAVSYFALPRSLGLKSVHNAKGMSDDKFRSIAYYTCDVGWDKKKAQSIPFIEYYWAEAYRSHFNIEGTETIQAYSQLVLDISRYTISLPDSYPLGDAGKNTKALGKREQISFDSVQDVIEAMVCEWDEKKAANGKMKLGKLGWAFYQQGVAIKDFPAPCNNPDSYAKRYDVSHRLAESGLVLKKQ